MLKKKEIALVLAEKKIRNNFVEWLDPIIVKECLNAESLLKSLNEKGSQPSLFFCEIALLPENDKVWQAVAVEKHKNTPDLYFIRK